MPWEDRPVDAQRVELVQLYLAGAATMTALCARFGVSTKTGHKWLRAYRSGGTAALADRSRRPHASPHRTPPDVETQVLQLADQHPSWGGKKLHVRLVQLGLTDVPAPSTITTILRRAGRLRQVAVTPQTWQRFEHPVANALWQMDFKGHQPLGQGRLHPLTILDDHSRYLLSLHALDGQTHEAVKAVLTACFQRYGLPWQLLTDNGPPWGSSEVGARTRLDIWLMQLGIRPIHGRPLHPQTQGKVERFHRTLQTDVFAGRAFLDLTEAQHAFDAFRTIYNHERPHAALPQMRVPGASYTVSPRSFPDPIPDPEYADDASVRIVSAGGIIQYQTRRLRIGKGFAGMRVAVRPTPIDGVIQVQFYASIIKEIDLRTVDRDGIIV